MPRSSVHDLLQRFSGHTVDFVGDALYDGYLAGRTRGIWPRGGGAGCPGPQAAAIAQPPHAAG